LLQHSQFNFIAIRTCYFTQELYACSVQDGDFVFAPEPQDADGFAIEELWRESWSVAVGASRRSCHDSQSVILWVASVALGISTAAL